MSPDKAWKKAERKTAIDIGGERTWWLSADVKGSGMSIEVKYRARLPEWLWEAVKQAERNADEDEFPAIRLVEKYKHRSICIMNWDTFVEWFGEFPAWGKDE